MSPTNKGDSSSKYPPMTGIMRRRRDGTADDSMPGAEQPSAPAAEQRVQPRAADEQLADGRAAEGQRAAAGAAADAGGEKMQIIGQELVPASQDLALRTPETGISKGGNQRVIEAQNQL